MMLSSVFFWVRQSYTSAEELRQAITLMRGCISWTGMELVVPFERHLHLL